MPGLPAERNFVCKQVEWSAIMDFTCTVAVFSFLSGGIGAYLGSYLKKKGENLATHEDIDKLVEQVRAVTTTTKEIEAKISGELWDRQKRWEAKRDSLLGAVKSLSSVDKHFSFFREIVDFGLKNQPPEEQNEQLFRAVKDYSEAEDMLNEAVLLVDMICGAGTVLTFTGGKEGGKAKIGAAG